MHQMDGSVIRFAEVFWKLDASLIEYRCIMCLECFKSHTECIWHVENCLQILLDSPDDSKEQVFEVPKRELDTYEELVEYESVKGIFVFFK